MKSFLALLVLVLLTGCTNPPPPVSVATPSTSPTAAPNKNVDVLIVGGGLSGLSTAFQLKKAGLSYRILETNPRVGGRVRSAVYPEQTSAEVGLAEFWDGNPAVDIAKELKVPLERGQLGMSSFMLDGKLQALTKETTNQEFLQKVLGPDYAAFTKWDAEMGKQIHVLESGKIPAEMMALKELTFEDWLKQAKLPEKAFQLVKAILEPEVGTGLRRISALDGIAEWHLFSGSGAMPNHVVGGNQNLTEAIANAVGRDNISLNTQVTNVIDQADGVEVRALETANFKNETFHAKCVVLTVPLYRLFEIQFEPRLQDDIYKAIQTQTWGAYFTAHVLLDKTAEKFWTVEGTSALPILTGGPLGVMYSGQSSNPDKILVNLLVTGDYAEVYNARTMSLDDVQKKLAEEFEKEFPGIGPMIKKWTFYRYHPRAIASWPRGRSRFDTLSEGLRKAHGHLYFAGDFTESSHSDGAVRSALRVTEQIKVAYPK